MVDDHHGTKVPDPYRPLEDPDAPESRAWIEAQNKLTFGFLEQIPARDRIKKRLTALWDYEKFGMPFAEGGRYFYSRNSGLQNQGVLYSTPSLDGEPRVLLDPNTLSPDGTVALTRAVVSDDGRLMAYGLASAGSDWQEWRVREVGTAADRDDHLRWVKFSSASWTKDGKGFFYSRYPEPAAGEDLKGANYYHKLYYHALGTPQAQDQLVYERPDQKDWNFHGEVTDDGRYLVVTVSKGTDDKYRILYKGLADGVVGSPAEPVELIGAFEHDYSFVDNDGPVFWFKTNKDAPRGRVIAIDTRRPSPEHWVEVIPQAAETLEYVTLVGGRFFAGYLKDARTQVKVFDLAGKFVRDVALPGLGSADGFDGKRTDRETFYSFTSFTTPTTVYRYDVASGQSTVFRAPKVDFDPDDYEINQVFYTSKDGTRVPMFVSHRKGLKRDGNNPTLLYGYGGFNVSLTPWFSPSNLVWMERGGVLAVPNLRGGGEYGEEWHQGGTKLNKQNVFDDFIAAAQWLIDNKVTSTPKLAIEGHSNGGLLVGACITQRPELFGAAVPGVGVLDMLRFHKFTIGWAWVDDYGSAADPEQFKALYAYSPLHNVKPGTCYPPTLITTADHDDRVVPAHSFKFAATLQAAQACDHPVLIRIETQAGHGAGKPTAKIIEEAADKWAFLVRVLGVADANGE
ncbi:MAG: Prolyl endopeptidase [uncultured Phycisphaerae bacterium]|uniref:prolyl oligopeptidase n=1 Tax=uncultured Phycisphaerae bacterium TaxID=904963 RepID=A0A6J4N6L6_9BACT|nr:MAG: Prolyl endopeptidase [uncultured Phycisphaerae bacterium]